MQPLTIKMFLISVIFYTFVSKGMEKSMPLKNIFVSVYGLEKRILITFLLFDNF